MSTVTWVLESEVFPKSHQSLRDAICTAGHQVVDWSDTWWQDGIPRRVGGGPTVFHGSLANAAAINDQLSWSPGSFCDTPTFNCSNWFAPAREWLLHTDWQILAADEFVESAALVCKQLGCGDQVFVRPNSPLKPFSGRVLNVDEVSLAALDYGFYFEDGGDGDYYCCVANSSATCGPTLERIPRADWNGDKLDGNGPSGITADPEAQQLVAFEYEWYGSGSIKFGWVIDGEIRIIHTF